MFIKQSSMFPGIELPDYHWKKYGAGWRAIRQAALSRASHQCEVGGETPWGRCTVSGLKPRFHVHHVSSYLYLYIWPILSVHEVSEMLGYAYYLAQQKHYDGLKRYLERNPELFPVVCPSHHAHFEFSGRYLLELITNRKRFSLTPQEKGHL